MRETGFIKQNKEKWSAFENILKEPKKDPDRLSELFIQLSDDLSYSRTFYPNRSVKLYLNNLTQQVFANLYKNKKEGWKKFWFFWKEELPQLVYSCRREFLISFLVFLLSAGIGVISSANDPDFPQQILGSGYVQMTKENINSGDPMKVYKKGSQLDMFLGITLNNLRVSFMTFLFGLIASIGTLGIMVYNGIMVGTFQYFFYTMESAHPGVLWQSVLTIWMHGTLEISSIIISGAAGLVLGKGLLFPGTYTRFQAFQLSARKGLKVLMGIAPVIIFAAFIESFVTRYTDVPDIVRILLIGISLAFVIGYFIVYPYLKTRNGYTIELFEHRLPHSVDRTIQFKQVKSSGEIFADIFIFYRRHFGKIFLSASIISVIATLLLTFAFKDVLKNNFGFGRFAIFDIVAFFNYENFKTMIWVNTLMFATLNFIVFRLLIKEAREGGELPPGEKGWLKISSVNFFKTLVPIAASNLILFFFPSWWGVLLFVFAFPLLVLWSFVMQAEGINIIRAIGRTRDLLLQSGWVKLMLVNFMLAILSFILFFLIDSPLLWLYVEVLSWNLNLSPESVSLLWMVLLSFMIVLGLNLILPVMVGGIGLTYFSLREMKEANHLRALIAQFGAKKKRMIYGNG